MKKEKTYLSDLTEYPHIYSKTYWGNFTTNTNIGYTDETISNRNDFIQTYNIKKRLWRNVKYVQKEFDLMRKYGCDHREDYENNDVYILIFSPYRPSIENDKKIIESGWSKIKPLYSMSAVTYCKVLKKKRR